MSDSNNRRPLKVRESKLSLRFARWLTEKGITPNQISIASVFFALLAAGVLVLSARVPMDSVWWMVLLAALLIQCRLLCNLFDGMVAIEGGKSTASGELFNDLPDRIADPLILVAVGYATDVVPWASALGWAAALGAVLTAYVRTMAASIGAPVDFRGPMAKQHRMALITVACVLAAFEPSIWDRGLAFVVALVIVATGCLVTVARRARSAYIALETTTDV